MPNSVFYSKSRRLGQENLKGPCQSRRLRNSLQLCWAGEGRLPLPPFLLFIILNRAIFPWRNYRSQYHFYKLWVWTLCILHSFSKSSTLRCWRAMSWRERGHWFTQNLHSSPRIPAAVLQRPHLPSCPQYTWPWSLRPGKQVSPSLFL